MLSFNRTFSRIIDLPYCRVLIAILMVSVTALADTAPLEITSDGQVRINGPATTSQIIRINSTLHLTPQASPPDNPGPGDIYFTDTEELLIYAHGKWHALLAAPASHGNELLTGTSGDWKVPAGVFAIQVSLVGGGGGCGRTYSYSGEEGSWNYPGGCGGHGGVIYHKHMDVVPGQRIPYTVGSGGAHYSAGQPTVFDGLEATGGSAGRNAASSGPGSAGSTGTPQEGIFPGGSSYGAGGSSSAGSPGAIFIEY